MKVYLTVGGEPGVRMETDGNLLKYIDAQVHGGALEIETPSGVFLDPTDDIKVYITAPVLEWVAISGAAELQTEGRFKQSGKIVFALSGASSGSVSVRAPEIELYCKGPSTLTVEGSCRDVKAAASSAATINAFELKAENGDAEASGASTVRVFSSIALEAKASGASSIRYRGNPNTTTSDRGASSVRRE